MQQFSREFVLFPVRQNFLTNNSFVNWSIVKQTVLQLMNIDLDSYGMVSIQNIICGRAFFQKYAEVNGMGEMTEILDSLETHEEFFNYLSLIGACFLAEFEPLEILKEIERLHYNAEEIQKSALSLNT